MNQQEIALVWCGIEILLVWNFLHQLVHGEKAWWVTGGLVLFSAFLISDIMWAVSLSEALHP